MIKSWRKKKKEEISDKRGRARCSFFSVGY
jgi:hypothetical protein